MNHAKESRNLTSDVNRMQWHDQALWFVREKRDKARDTIPEWEDLRHRAAGIKESCLNKLDHYLELFSQNAERNGVQVHWAWDAEAHNQIVFNILKSAGVAKLVKSKSMLTEECGLNPFLEKRGIEVIDTDLGERIIQLRHEPPSHIVLPAIHLKKEDVGKLFEKELDTEKGNSDPSYLTNAARKHLRNQFLTAGAGLSGVNFGVAETGGVVLCTNEGNGDLGATYPPIHIACMGIEKLVPTLEDLAVFTRLLARSATGQPITAYTSHFNAPKPGGEMHIVIVDNGRSQILAHPEFRKSLQCIRCGACLNTCPVYRRSGGHSYGYPIPGPIGSVLAPHRNMGAYKSLPYASSLCGSCTNVCPVRINLHEQLLEWRKEIVKAKHLPVSKRLMMWGLGRVMTNPGLYRLGGKLGGRMLNTLPDFILNNRLNPWTKGREMPVFSKKSFREEYKKRKNGR
jgi:L-lactate dehydrogenase complex protein LldF